MSSPRHDGPILAAEVVAPGGLSLQGPHRVEAFATCPQLEAFAHELHLRSIFPKEPTDVGVLWHAGLAYHYAKGLNPRPPWYVYSDGFECIERMGATKPREFIDTARRMLEAYQLAYVTDAFTPLLVEHQFVVYFPNGEPYSCRSDTVGWMDYGTPGQRLVVMDHKGVGRMGNEGAKYAIDSQMATNLALARACGYDIKEIVINAQSRRTYECRRFTVPINSAAYARIGSDVQYYLDQMKAIRQSHPDPMNRPRNRGACVRKYGPCEFIELCWGGAGMDQFHVPADHVRKR